MPAVHKRATAGRRDGDGTPHATRDGPRCASARREAPVLWTIFVILLILWLLGFVTNYTMGGFIHILLVIAIVVVLLRVIQGRRPI